MFGKTEHKALIDLSESLCKVCGPKLAAWLEGHKAKPKRAKALVLKDGEVDRAEFVRALTECARVAKRAMGGDFVNAVRVAFAPLEGGALRMRATDGEVFVSRDFTKVVDAPGPDRPERLLDAAPMLRWLKTRKGKALAVKVGEGAVAFGDGGSAMAFTFLPTPEDGGPSLPSAPDGDWTRLVAMPAPDVISMFRRTAFAASDRELRYAMNAVHLEARGRKGALKLEAAATDGRRLAVVGPLDGGEAKGEALVPLAAVASIQKLLRDDGDSTVSLSTLQERDAKGSMADDDYEPAADYFRAESGCASVVARCVDGRFPSHRDVIPKEFTLKVVADKAALVDALKSVSAFRGDEVRAAVMEVGEGGIVFSPTNPEHKDKRFAAPARVEGEMGRTGWNSDFILDALAVVDDGGMTLEFAGEAGAMVLSQGDFFRYVLMSVGLRGEPDEEPA